MDPPTSASNFTIEIPNNIDDWGRTLITSLNKVFSGIVNVIHGDTRKLSTEFADFKNDILHKTKDAADLAAQAMEGVTRHDQAIQNIQRELIILKHNNIRLHDENLKLKQQTNMNEAYSRRKNLVIRGIPELNDDVDTTSDDLSRKFFIEQMKIENNKVDQMRFVCTHRMGKRAQFYPRPIIVRFCEFSDRQCVWEARKNLGSTQFSINENYPQEVEYNRRKLYPLYKLAKSTVTYRGKVSLRGDVLVINSKDYTVDTIGNLPDEIHPRHLCYKSDNNTFAFGGLYSEYCNYSNWKTVNFTYDNTQFTSSEQAYMHTKAIKSNDTESAVKILGTDSPKEVKRLGGEVSGLNVHSWNKIKGDIMLDILRCKFGQNPNLKQELLDSGNKKMIESGNSAYYSAGLPLTNKHILDFNKHTGKNKLGEFLQTIRAEFRD